MSYDRTCGCWKIKVLNRVVFETYPFGGMVKSPFSGRALLRDLHYGGLHLVRVNPELVFEAR